MTSTICLGDSLTAGHPGRTFLRYMGAERRCVNRGLGGATLLGLLGRIERGPVPEASTVILEIGANDILLPYMHENRPLWRSFVETIYRSGMLPSRTPESFEENYRALLGRLLDRAERILCVGIPMLGEEKGSPLNRRVEELGRIVERVARDGGATFLDLFAWQSVTAGGSAYLLGETPDSLAMDSVSLRDESAEAAACRERGLEVTVDGVHLNKRGALQLATMLEELLDRGADRRAATTAET